MIITVTNNAEMYAYIHIQLADTAFIYSTYTPGTPFFVGLSTRVQVPEKMRCDWPAVTLTHFE